MKTQEVIFYFDDSGVLHPKAKERYFVYAGYVFLSKNQKKRANLRYLRALKSQFPHTKHEIKGCNLKHKQKCRLNAILEGFESLSCTIDKRHVYEPILANKLSIRRYKDYCVKRMIKAKLVELIHRGYISPDLPISISIKIDKQPSTTNGFYNLRDSVFRELSCGISSFVPLFHKKVKVSVTYCDSRYHPLIQASDLLANSLYHYQNTGDLPTFNPSLHTAVTFP